MKRMPKIKYILATVAAFLLLCGLTVTAYADADSPSFTYSYPVDGVEFRLYEVGEIVNDEFILHPDFAQYQVNLQDKTAGETLAAYVERDGMMPYATGITENGSVRFEALDPVIYLMIGDTAIKDEIRYIPSAVLFSVPQKDKEGNLVWDITAGGKYDKEDTRPPKDISIEKIWKDSGYESTRPAMIKAQLLKDGEVYDTVELSKANNWKYKWEKLDPAYTWTVVEESVPDRYVVSKDTADGVELLINTHEDSKHTPTPTPTNPNIPYTGQLWWPVGILIVVGIGLILIGLIRRKKSE